MSKDQEPKIDAGNPPYLWSYPSICGLSLKTQARLLAIGLERTNEQPTALSQLKDTFLSYWK
jgi:hypothetical protein